ncbi:MAG: peptidoglycan editing factor PgeF [Chlamydiota bacterium]
MISKNVNGLEFLQYELFAEEPRLVHGIFLRRAEESSRSLNVSPRAGDPLSVEENRRLILNALQLDRCIDAHLVHGCRVARVDHEESPGICDGMMTALINVGLMIPLADCQGAIFYDPIRHVVANVHSGWRGNVQNIYQETVLQMQKEFGSKPDDLLVGVSPSLGPDHSEFKNHAVELPPSFSRFQVRPTYFDLWAVARAQLEEVGVLPHHIQIAEICTYSRREDFFSYRRDKSPERQATVAAIL